MGRADLRAGKQLGDKEQYMEGYVQALRHIAENLRQGGYLPGGTPYEDTISGTAF
jgi:hypothetical protein